MKPRFKTAASIVLLLLLCAFVGRADKPRAKGYYIDKTGQKIQGSIEVPTKLMSKKVENHQLKQFTFFDKRGKKSELTEKEATELGFSYEGEDLVFRVLPDIIQKSTFVDANFYKLLLDGPCSVFQIYMNYGKSGYYKQYLLFRGEDHYYMTTDGTPNNNLISASGRIKSTKEFFEDCPELVEKIKNKDFKNDDERCLRMAQFYNTSCKTSATDEKEQSEE